MAKEIKELITVLDGAVLDFQKKIPGIQDSIFSELMDIIKDLDIKDGRISNSVKNIRVIGAIRKKIERLVLSDEYKQQVKDYLKTFTEVSSIQNRYFTSITKKFKPKPVLAEIRKQSIEATVQSLTEAGINANVSDKITDILRQNITTGGKYAGLQAQLREFIVKTPTTAGVLERYTSQITTDAINQYSAQYSQVISSDLGLEWYSYVGSNLATTRQFCEMLTEKDWVFNRELPDIVNGKIDGEQAELNQTTGLPKGMVAGTNASNFHVYRGGYNCGHQLYPVAEIVVPKDVRVKAYQKYGVKYDERGLKI